MFSLDSRLKSDTIFIDSLNVCDLLLMDDQKYPWFILVPRVEGAIEFTNLDFDIQVQALKDINYVSSYVNEIFQPDKINIATLGNVVNQLHIHVIDRFKDDYSFPSPVWCDNIAKKYDHENIIKIIDRYNEYKLRAR